MDDNCPETSALKAEQMDVVMGNVGGRDVFLQLYEKIKTVL